jgi:hypothetical protein
MARGIIRFSSRVLVASLALLAAASAQAAGSLTPEPAESQRLLRAKDLIADEQWVRAIHELTAAADDPKEPNRDEALFWLAHSQHQAGQSSAALATIGRLERGYPRSRWTRPARSLRLEIAERLGRFDVLWYTAVPPAPPAAPPTAPAVAPAPAPSAVPAAPPAPRGTGARPAPAPPSSSTPRALPPPPGAHPAPVPPPMPPPAWVATPYIADTDMRIQALGSLIRTDAHTVIPMLKAIALETENPGEARRALFVLAQSGRPEARLTVVEVAKTGPEVVQLAAVRELGRFHGPAVSNELLQVYATANEPVKFQVVSALGERSATAALMRIAQSETHRGLREAAIVTLGQAGGREQLTRLYVRASAETRRPIIVGLFNAKADEELIRIAERERNATVRAEVLEKLRLLGTPRAKEYLQRIGHQ